MDFFTKKITCNFVIKIYIDIFAPSGKTFCLVDFSELYNEKASPLLSKGLMYPVFKNKMTFVTLHHHHFHTCIQARRK